jgi:hypothetical protein
MKKRYLKVAVLILLAMILLVLVLAPVIVKNQAIKRSKELIGRQISLEKLKVSYFSTTIRLMDFVLFDADEEEAFVSFDTLIVNLAPLKLIRNDMVIKKLYLAGLSAHIIQEDSLFNFTDLLEYHQADESENTEVDTTSGEPFKYIFSNLELHQANLSFTDASIDKTLYAKDLAFFIPHIAWDQEDRSEAGIRFNFPNGGFLDTELNIDPKEGEFDAEITIHKLYLHEFKEFLKKSLHLDSIAGQIHTNLHIMGDLDEIQKSTISGVFEIHNFEITDDSQKKLIALGGLDLSIQDIDLHNQNFLFDSLTLTQPYVQFELYDSTNNMFKFLGIQPSPETDSLQEEEPETDSLQSPPASSLSYALNSFIIDDGSIDYTDHRTPEPFSYDLTDLDLSVDSISSQEDWIDLYARMLLNNRGKLNAELGIDPRNPMNMTLDVGITDFILSDLNIYSRHYLGSPIIRGDMFYQSKTIIRGGQLSSENKLVIENVEVGDKEGGMHDLPLKFAVFLLKDREGVINLDVPVRGDLKNPEISVGKIVWATFKNLIVKTVTAPYDLLADMIGVDPKDIQAIEFAYGDSLLTDQRTEQLKLLLSLEEKKEGLGIELIYYNDAEKETGHLFLTEAGENLPSLSEADSLNLALSYAELTETFSLTRISIVESYLKSINDSTAIVISRSHADAPGNLGSSPRFEVKYSMEEYKTEN